MNKNANIKYNVFHFLIFEFKKKNEIVLMTF